MRASLLCALCALGTAVPATNLPPLSRGLPLLGDTLKFLSPKSMASYQVDRMARHGSLWRTKLLFKDAVVVTGATALAELAKEERNKPMTAFFPPQQKALFGPSSLLVNSGSRHLVLRRLVGQALSSAAVASYEQMLDQAVEECVHRCIEHGGGDNGIALADEMRHFSLLVGARLILGSEVRADDIDAFALDLEIWSRGLTAAPLFFLPWSSASRAMRARGRIEARLLPLIQHERSVAAKLDQKSTLLNRLVLAKDESDNVLRDSEIIDNVLTLLFAGSDTTASGLTSCLKELAVEPQLLADLQHAVRTAPGAGATDELLDALIAEVHRRNPPAPFQMRLVGEQDVEINGYQVPAGWLVVYGYAGTLLADSTAYRNPNTFDISRWQTEREKNPPNWAFGGGPRMCPGRMLALVESRALLKRILNSNGFTWNLVSGQQLQSRYNPGLFPVDRLRAVVFPASSDA